MQTFADYESNDRPWYINEISLALRRTYGHSWWCVKASVSFNSKGVETAVIVASNNLFDAVKCVEVREEAKR
ncbi:hypothetical protein P5673_028853 [Acropora cervicornis]|uniref:Uncharacterized protein n=1 Tax=Acropora cervicornis TaxID=6130 RepID=A0AAD9UUJ7_ACRCE|nr:hypothetical protein P5673_028853 [Acropora cervicornis]